MSKRSWVLLASGIPLLGLLALLGWASAQSGGNPGGFGVNSEFGQVDISSKTPAEFSLRLLDGSDLALSDLRGKVVMLDFWSSWCPPCRQEAPTLAEVYREYAGQPVEFIGIDIWDQKDDALAHISEYDVPYPNGIDAKGTIAIDYGVTGLPEKFFISAQGALLKKFVGPMNAGDLRAALEEALASGSPPAGS